MHNRAPLCCRSGVKVNVIDSPARIVGEGSINWKSGNGWTISKEFQEIRRVDHLVPNQVLGISRLDGC